MASPKGEWIIEGYGVDPDIEVDNDPKSEIEGKDPQLNAALPGDGKTEDTSEAATEAAGTGEDDQVEFQERSKSALVRVLS